MNFPVFLVLIQILSIIFIMLTGKIIPSNPVLFIFLIISLLFAIWAMAEMKFRFNIFPALLQNSSLVTSGPFKLVRHPIYSSLLLMTMIWIFSDPTLPRIIVWLILTGVLNLKIHIEEKILTGEFPDYIDYKSKTKKLIPFIY